MARTSKNNVGAHCVRPYFNHGWGARSAPLLGLLFLAITAHARINVVTLPDRDTVQLTIYNSADLTMVKETRHLTFRQGLNKLEFSWANTLIDPTSVEFHAARSGISPAASLGAPTTLPKPTRPRN